MRFYSTRSAAHHRSFREALLQGLAPDGGLYVPAAVPPVPPIAWQHAATFPTLATGVLTPWLADEVPPETLAEITASAFDFPVPLVPLTGAGWENVSVLELFHGPTLSFKDFGARTMARLMAHFLHGSGEKLTILVATSGDTGSAVADGFAGHDNLRVVLLYPKGQVSPTQERQLIAARPGVTALAVRGTFDDCQRLVKAAFAAPDLANYGLSSANSINVGRLLPQMLYYFWGLRQLGSQEAVCCVPSGNLGNLTAGVLAWQSGLPVRRFLAAHNANDFFPLHLAGQDVPFRPSVQTLSNAMDVGAPSNFERLQHLLPPETLRHHLWGTSVTDAETRTALRHLHAATGYLADPHTAVGLEAVRRYREATGDTTPAIVLATAHPAKFPETLTDVLGQTPEAPPRLAALWDQPTAVQEIDATLAALQDAALV